MKSTLIKLLVPASVTAFLLFLGGCHPHHNSKLSPEEMVDKMEDHIEKVLKKIDATPEQKDVVMRIASLITEDAATTRTQLQDSRGTIVNNLLAENPDRQKLHGELDAKSSLLNGFMHRTLDRMIEINAQLTDEQRVALKSRFEKSRHWCR